MRGGATDEAGVEGEQQHPVTPTPPLQQHQGGSALSAAPSQVSLATSERDLSSVPASTTSSSLSLTSSSGVTSPDLPQHAPHTVAEEEPPMDTELPSNGYGKEAIIDCGLDTPEARPGCPPQSYSMFDTNEESMQDYKGREHLLRVENGLDVQGSDMEEEYFEDYHLPNTHENAFVRHRSYRRKVELTPINAPDADRIEVLLRTGEFERHGSIRRKIVANIGAKDDEGLYKLEENDGQVHEFSEDFREIELLMDGDDEVETLSKVTMDQLRLEDNLLGSKGFTTATPKLLMRGNNAYTSTPNNVYASTADYASIDLSASLHDNTHSGIDTHDTESLSIEQSTLTKVKECMDFSRCKDMYRLTGKLQDMLSAVEVEEVLNNSHRYVDCIDTGVLEALFNSITEQMSLSGQPMSISFNKPDTNKVVEEKELSSEEFELQKSIKQKLLMEELAMDSLPYINPQSTEELVTESDLENVTNNAVVMRHQTSQDSSEGEGSRYSTIERRKSVRVSTGPIDVELEGVFVESDFKNSKLKTIPAPNIDLMTSDLDISDCRTRLGDDSLARDEVFILRVSRPDDEGSQMSIPSIRITRTESAKEEDTWSANNLYVGEEPCSPCSDTTSVDYNEQGDFGVCRPSRISMASSVGSPPVQEDPVEPSYDRASDHPGACAPQLPPLFLPDAEEEEDEERHWRSVVIAGVWRRIDMKVIAPYRKCISPGGHHASHAVVVVSACQLPERGRRDYAYVMDNLFLYLLSRLEQLVSDDYILVYLSGGHNVPNTGPSFHWLKAAYQMIDRKLRKNLQALLVVHPTLWVRTIVALTRPFISSKFYRKLTFVYSLTELAQLIPLDQLEIPASVHEADFELMIREKKRNVARRRQPAALHS